MSQTNEIFQQSIKPQLEKALQGYNFTVFSYGITSSGKTYTQVGNQHQQGIIPLSVQYILKELTAEQLQHSDIKHIIYVSYFEIYNEQIQDLIQYSDTPLQIIERQGVIDIRNLSKHPVDSIDQIKQLFNKANENRSTASTAKNMTSSRSHSIFQILVQKLNTVTRQITQFKANFCDLAGSERVLDQETKIRRREGVNINLSLSSLTNVIKQIVEQNGTNKGFINYRQSKLTHVLKDALGGNSLTTMICNVSAGKLCQQETLQTLRFSQMAKKVVNNIQQCQILDQNADPSVLQQKINEMEIELQKLQNKNNLQGKDKLKMLIRQGSNLQNFQKDSQNAEYIRNGVSKSLKNILELQNQLNQMQNSSQSYQQVKLRFLFYKQQLSQLQNENTQLLQKIKKEKTINYIEKQQKYNKNIKLLDQLNSNTKQHTEIIQNFVQKINQLQQITQFNEGLISKFIPQQYLNQLFQQNQK